MTHVIDFRDDGWTIRHPLSCRPNLFDCRVNRAAEDGVEGPPKRGLGAYRCEAVAGALVVGSPATEQDLTEDPDFWIVPKTTHDQNAIVGPRITRTGNISRAAGLSDPEHTRFYAAKLLAAADEAERAPSGGPTGGTTE